MSPNFKIDCTYENIIEKFASFIYNSCHNLALWSSVPEFAKSGYSKTFSLERIYPALGDSRFLNPGPNLYATIELLEGLAKLNTTIQEIKKDIIEYSAANITNWTEMQPYSENIIYFVNYLLSYCYTHLDFYRQVYSISYASMYPCTFLVYKTCSKPENYQLKILENESIPAEVIHAMTEVVKQEFDWNPALILKGDKDDEYGAYKAIFEKIKQRLNVNNLKYTLTWPVK